MQAGDSMIDLLLRDSKLRPDLFSWTCSILLSDIEQWESEQAITVPEDLKQIWSLRGGGELFESETVLQPLGSPEDDLVIPRSKWLWGKGLESSHYVFHEGLYVSVFQSAEESFVSLNSTDFRQIGSFQTLDDWYLHTLRAEYADRYGLPRV